MIDEKIRKKIRYDKLSAKWKAERVDNTLNLKEWMYETRIYMDDMAKILGISRSYLFQLRKGEKNPSKKLMQRIKEVTMEDISEPKHLLDEGCYAKESEAKTGR